MRDCRLDIQDESEELNDYEKHMKWFDECSGGNFVNWYKNKEDLCESEKKVKFFSTVKPVLSGHSKRRPKIGFQDRLLLNAGQKHCRMLS